MPASSNRSIRPSASEQTGTVKQPIPLTLGDTSKRALWPGWLAIWDFLRGPYPTLVSRAVVGGVFLLAGISKALDMHAFAGEIDAYQMVPGVLVQPMSIALALLEILVGAYLLLGLMQRLAAIAAGALL